MEILKQLVGKRVNVGMVEGDGESAVEIPGVTFLGVDEGFVILSSPMDGLMVCVDRDCVTTINEMREDIQ